MKKFLFLIVLLFLSGCVIQRNGNIQPNKKIPLDVNSASTTQLIFNDQDPLAASNVPNKWTKYSNTSLGINFEIPDVSSTPSFSYCEVQNSNLNNSIQGVTIGSTINITSEPTSLSLNDFVDNFVKNQIKNDSNWKMNDKMKKNVNNVSAIDLIFQFGGTGRNGEIIFLKNDERIYQISYSGGGWTCGFEPAVWEHVVSTFKLNN